MKTLKWYIPIALLFFTFSLVAQNRSFEDDIFFSPRRTNPVPQAQAAEPKAPAVAEREVQAPVVLAEMNSERDVDEYNRRYAAVYDDGGEIETIYEYVDGELAQRIVMFHDPSKITIAGGDNVNIYYDGENYEIDFAQVRNPQVSLNFGIGLGSPWHSPWGWNNPWYWSDPWYFNRWHSSWHWNSWNNPWNNPWYWNTWNRPGWGWTGPGYWGWNRPVFIDRSYSGNRGATGGSWDRNRDRNPSVIGNAPRTQGAGNVNSTVRSSTREPRAVGNPTTRSSTNAGTTTTTTSTTRTRESQPSTTTTAPSRSSSNVSTPSSNNTRSSSGSSVGSGGSTRSSAGSGGGFSSGGGSSRSSSGAGSSGGRSR